jgi:hypothetical protein
MEPPGGLLTLRHASKRSSGTWGSDDCHVIQAGRTHFVDAGPARMLPPVARETRSPSRREVPSRT